MCCILPQVWNRHGRDPGPGVVGITSVRQRIVKSYGCPRWRPSVHNEEQNTTGTHARHLFERRVPAERRLLLARAGLAGLRIEN